MENNELLLTVVPAVVVLFGTILGLGLGYLKEWVKATPTKLDDAVWNKLVNEFAAAGIITPAKLEKLHALPKVEE